MTKNKLTLWKDLNLKLSVLFIFGLTISSAFSQEGCTDPLASNFDDLAMINDGSCIYATTSISSTEIVNPLSSDLVEQSGMQKEEDFLWIHLDSGNGTKLFAFDLTSLEISQELTLQNIENKDWEDIASDDEFLYLGDFGNNQGNRTDLKIWKIQKDELSDNDPEIINPEIISFNYPEQIDFSNQNNNHNFDCEAMIVFQGNIYIFLKEWISNNSSVYKIPNIAGDHQAQFLGSFNVGGLITGADVNADLGLISLIGYEIGLGVTPFIYMLWDFQNDDFESGNKRRINLDWANHQTESIAYNEDGKWYVGNEYFEIGPIGFFNQLREINLSAFIAPPTALIEHSSQEQLIYPNPSNGIISIPSDINHLQIFNQMGILIFESTGNEQTSLNLKTGSYVFIIQRDNAVYKQKVLVGN